MNRTISRTFVILAVALILTACTSLQQAHTNIDTLHASFESLIAGRISASELTLTDLQNGKANYEQHFAATGNPYDKAGVQCAASLIAYFPTLQAAFGPLAAQPVQAAPVTGFFSAAAAKQIAAEDARAAIAAKEALLRNGFPAEVTIACAPIRDFIGMALSHGGSTAVHQ